MLDDRNYSAYMGPGCECDCAAERDRFQGALDEIGVIVGDKPVVELSDADVAAIREQVAKS